MLDKEIEELHTEIMDKYGSTQAFTVFEQLFITSCAELNKLKSEVRCKSHQRELLAIGLEIKREESS